jgi:zinc protease
MKVSKSLLQNLGITFVKEFRGVAEYRLNSNGLKIILAENHASPIVTVMPLYRVGSRNETVGHTGATHILEHMMFKGVKNGRTGEIYSFDDVVRPVGGTFNATTWLDRTNYFEVVPRQHLEACIALEADRMRNLIISGDELKSEMTVVRNELERGQNQPSRILMEEAYSVAFREHPYHWPTIGWTSDVENISAEKLRWFYNTFYWPDNTSVVLIGDFDSAHALTLCASYYGVHPRAPEPIPVMHTTEPRQEGPRQFTINRAGDAAHVVVAYRAPAASHQDTHALDAAATVLGGSSKTSRLYQTLVEQGLCANVQAYHMAHRDHGMFMVMATCAAFQSPERVAKAIVTQVEILVRRPPSEDELRRAKSASTKSAVLAGADPMQTASAIAEAEAVSDWMYHAEYADRFNAVAADDVRRVATDYLIEDNRTTGYFIPTSEDSGEAEVPSGTAIGADKTEFAAKTQKFVLDNGLTVLLMPAPGNGIVAISGKLSAGSGHSAHAKSLVGGMTASMLTSGGSINCSAQKVAETMEEMGAGVGFRMDNFATRFTTQVVKSDMNAMLAMIADLLRNPAFPQKELDVLKMRTQMQLLQAGSDTESVASGTLARALYGEESIYFDKPFADVAAELPSLTVDDLRVFHKAFISPKGAVITLVGDFDADKALVTVKAAFGDWSGPEVKPVEVAEAKMPTERRRIDVDIPGKANASIVIGHPSIYKKGQPDSFAAHIANTILGGGMSARLADAVRVKAGLTYGIYSSFNDGTKGGAPFSIDLSVNPINVDKALKLIDEVMVEFLKNGVTEKEAASESKAAGGTFMVQLRQYSSIASTLTEYESSGQGVEAMDSFAARMQSLTKADIDAAVRKYIRPESFVTVVAGTLSK